MKQNDQVLEVWGDFACFTRPELKVERFSYPVITPSAARGIYDSIYCKPSRNPAEAEFRWQITSVEILSLPKYIALRRNEVKDKASVANIKKWMKGTAEPEPIFADATKGLSGTDQKGRTQRQTMALKNVHYRLHAKIIPWNGKEERIKGFEAQFQRRAKNGKCIYQPYFGCREFPAFFELVEGENTDGVPISLDQDLGLMLYDVFDLSKPGTCEDQPSISLFRAKVKKGVMKIPEYESNEVIKSIGGVV